MRRGRGGEGGGSSRGSYISPTFQLNIQFAVGFFTVLTCTLSPQIEGSTGVSLHFNNFFQVDVTLSEVTGPIQKLSFDTF